MWTDIKERKNFTGINDKERNMKNRHDLLQLERDAKKQGAWQAKLAYASYLLAYSPEQTEQAKIYLQEIINHDIRAYITEAKFLFETHFSSDGKRDAVALDSLEKTKASQNGEVQLSYTRKISGSLEFQYKKIRYEYDNPHRPEKKRRQIINTTIMQLEALLEQPLEMTDTLRAKIYFQLIRLHLEHANQKGQRSHVEEAKKYCQLLIKDSTLSSMVKAKHAEKIYDQIRSITDTPIYHFTTHIKESFKAGRKGNKILFKYAGVVLGNVIDFSLLVLPKIISKSAGDINHVRKGKTFPVEFFKNAGFGYVFKKLGEKFGKHVMGNMVGGPIGAVFGAFYYPFEYLNQKYKTSSNIKEKTNGIIKLKKPLMDEHSSTNHSVNQTLISIFERTSKIPSKKIDYLKTELDTEIKVKPNRSFIPMEKSTKAYYAYGSVFANAVKTKQGEVDGEQSLLPIYKKIQVN